MTVNADVAGGGDKAVLPSSRHLASWLRIIALAAALLALPFLINNILTYWHDWPGVTIVIAQLGADQNLAAADLWRGWGQAALYFVTLLTVITVVLKTSDRSMSADAQWLTGLSLYIVRAAFWAVLLIGLSDGAISFLRVEGFLDALVGDQLGAELGRPNFRGHFVHYPLIALSLVIAYYVRSLGFVWMAFLIVMAEFMIVVFRFVFSYEQAFMGDLVRFWYAALFLFASAYTLMQEAHVRVDILYTRFSARGKAWTNTIGSLALGIPLCWVILTRGMAGRATLINAPLLSFEVSQSGYGLFVKYLMAGFLVVYALSMLAQFASYFLANAATLLNQPGSAREDHPATV